MAETIARVNEARARDAAYPKPPLVITTNFDGLIEVALRQRGIRCRSRGIVRDDYPQSQGEEVEIWHVHGYWCSEPTLHTPGQFTQKRESLEQGY